MSKIVKFRRDSEASCKTYTGPAGELIIDTTNWCIRLQDGSTPGGRVINSTVNTNSGDVIGPATTTSGNIPVWGASNKTLTNGLVVGTKSGNILQLDGLGRLPAVDASQLTNLPVSGTGDVLGPASTSAGYVPVWTSGTKTLANGYPVGTGTKGSIVVLDSNAKLPAIDGSQLINLPISSSSGDVLGPSTTTSGLVPTWSSTNKTLTTGLSVGTSPNNLVQLTGDGKLPALDGSNLQNVGSVSVLNSTSNYIPKWASSKTLTDGYTVVTTLRDNPSDTAIPTEQAVSSKIANAVASAGGGDVLAPANPVTGYVPKWSSTSKTLTEGIPVGGANGLVVYDSTGKLPPVNASNLQGVAILDNSNKIPLSYLPDLSALTYKGTWNASTNSPTIPTAAAANNGWYYKVSIAGTTSIGGNSTWKVGDWVISNGVSWDRIEQSSSDGDVLAPTTTTYLKVPQWDSVARKLTDGLTVGTGSNCLVQLDASGNLPTQIVNNISNAVSASLNYTTVTNNIDATSMVLTSQVFS